ncbi:MAG: chemotaxis protein CheW, partial [Nitrospiraceae bacterium]
MREHSETRRSIDWEDAYARIEGVRQALDGGEALSSEAVKRILQDRARALARPREAPATISETLELLVFALGEERYAV